MATAYAPSTIRYISPARPVQRTSRKLSVTLWTLQLLLAVIFVMTGAMKLLTPADIMEAQAGTVMGGSQLRNRPQAPRAISLSRFGRRPR